MRKLRDPKKWRQNKYKKKSLRQSQKIHLDFRVLHSSIPLSIPGRDILEDLILRIALAAGSIFSSSTGSVLENILPALLGVGFPVHSQ